MKPRFFLAILTLVCLCACGGTLQVGLEHNPDDPAQTTAPVFTLPSATPIEPTLTSIAELPTQSVPIPTETQVQPVPTSGPQMVQVYLIALEDNGQGGDPVGCGDSAIPVQVQIEPTQGVLKAAVQALLAIKDQYYGQSGLYNSLYQSNLQVDSVILTAGKAEVRLSGTLQLAGECDNPRVQAQLEKTVLQFSTVTSADIFINGKTLAEALSLK